MRSVQVVCCSTLVKSARVSFRPTVIDRPIAGTQRRQVEKHMLRSIISAGRCRHDVCCTPEHFTVRGMTTVGCLAIYQLESEKCWTREAGPAIHGCMHAISLAAPRDGLAPILIIMMDTLVVVVVLICAPPWTAWDWQSVGDHDYRNVWVHRTGRFGRLVPRYGKGARVKIKMYSTVRCGLMMMTLERG
jgi:hypothetical protein